MSQCTVPNWNLRQQRQEEQVEDREESNRSPHVQSDQNLCYIVPLCDNNEVRELTWQNEQISLHGFLPKQSWEGKAGDSTLESIVHQATTFSNNNIRLIPSSSYAAKWDENQHQKWRENSSHIQVVEHRGDEVKVNSTFCGEKRSPLAVKVNSTVNNNASCGEKLLGEKRVRCESQRRHGFHGEESACGSGSAAFCRGADTTMMTWASFESGRSLKSARTADDDSVYHDCSENQDGEGTTKEESYRSHSSARRSHAAAIHNLSERRRRDRINQKMKTLQKMVPNASKTDKASMLDEVIEYLKQLQAQVQMLSNARNMSQIMMPLGMQQQLQMSLLARMGMGIGMGMLDINNLARNVPNSFPPLINAATALGGTTPSFVSPPFTMPPVLVPPPTQLKQNVDHATIRTSVPNFNDAYNTFLAQQSMSMDFLNKMSALYRQQGSSQHPLNKPASSSLPNDGQS